MFEFSVNGQKWIVFFNPMIERSYCDFSKKEICIKRPIDIIHEILHVAVNLDLGEIEPALQEYLVTTIANRLEMVVVENDFLGKILTLVDKNKK